MVRDLFLGLTLQVALAIFMSVSLSLLAGVLQTFASKVFLLPQLFGILGWTGRPMLVNNTRLRKDSGMNPWLSVMLCCQCAPGHDGAVPHKALPNHTQTCCRDFMGQIFLPANYFPYRPSAFGGKKCYLCEHELCPASSPQNIGIAPNLVFIVDMP